MALLKENAEDYLSGADSRMGALIARAGQCRLRRKRRSPYEALVQAVVYQQLNGTAASTILSRVKALYAGNRIPPPDTLLATADEKLRAAGLSRGKTLAIKDIALKAREGVVPTTREAARLSDAELVERLTAIRGVGPWTVEMLLIFTLGRPDVLPVTDYGVRKGFALLYHLEELPGPKELLSAGEKWRPYRSTAAWYLWRVLELDEVP